MADSYLDLDNPYDALMTRTPGGISPAVNDVSELGNQPAAASSYNDPTTVGASSDSATYNGMQGLQTSTGPVETQPINSTGSLDNVWMRTFIRSIGWRPKERGFTLEGSTGYAEFSDIYLNSPEIYNPSFSAGITGVYIYAGIIDSDTTYGNINPISTDTYTLGESSSLEWSDIYLRNSPHVSSDERLKTDIVDITYGLKEIELLRPVEYKRRGSPENKIGLIAQETMPIIPEIVGGTEKEYYHINYMDLIPVLIRAVQELSDRVEKLEKRET